MRKKLKSHMVAVLMGAFMVGASGAASAVHSFWSPLTSEETPPVTSSNEYLIDALRCTGAYCDNISIRNAKTWRQYGTNSWQGYFSEEGNNSRICGGNSFMTGIACSGAYCDNVAIQCTNIKFTTKGHCEWTPAFSEEAGYLYLPAGSYAAGLQCEGAYCDNMRVLACQAL